MVSPFSASSHPSWVALNFSGSHLYSPCLSAKCIYLYFRIACHTGQISSCTAHYAKHICNCLDPFTLDIFLPEWLFNLWHVSSYLACYTRHVSTFVACHTCYISGCKACHNLHNTSCTACHNWHISGCVACHTQHISSCLVLSHWLTFSLYCLPHWTYFLAVYRVTLDKFLAA